MRAALIALVVTLTVAVPATALAAPAGGSPTDVAAKKKHHKHTPKPKPKTVVTPPATIPAPVPPVVPASCDGADLVPSAANLAAVQAATLCLVNQQRAAQGRVALADNPILDRAASAKVSDLIARDYFDHTTPTGNPFSDLLTQVGYVVPGTSFRIGENLAWAQGELVSPRQIVAGWMQSPHHRDNILGSQFRESGLAVLPAVPAGETAGLPAFAGATYVQEFGSRG